MSKGKDRTVFKREDGQWANARVDSSRPSSLHKTQKDAVDEARRMLIGSGGGELTVMGVDGKIRKKDTIGSGNDPRSIKG